VQVQKNSVFLPGSLHHMAQNFDFFHEELLLEDCSCIYQQTVY
jgi:hypothetical protein